MEDAIGALLRALGTALSFFYEAIPSYVFAIVLLTVAVRLLILPLAVKQTRSMQGLQKIQPELKAIQRKYKGNRQKLQEETMKLYKEHGVNPLGGCLPLLLQLPIFFALFSVLRAATPALAIPAEPVPLSQVRGDDVFCAPAGEPSATGAGPEAIECQVDGETSTFGVGEWLDAKTRDPIEAPPWVTRCQVIEDEEDSLAQFQCLSPVGSGHLPKDGELFAQIVDDGEPQVGVYLSCGATQAQSEQGIRTCGPRGADAGGGPLVGYYGLIALMVATTWYQTKQMQAATPQQPGGAQTIARIMPIFLGFISLTIPAGVLVYWVTTNGWQIGQQYVMLRAREAQAEKAVPEPSKREDPPAPPVQRRDGPPRSSGKRGGRSGRSRKKRRKR